MCPQFFGQLLLGELAQPDTLRYCIESTGTYHFPALKAWAGIASVVNPLLAGPSRRKTDELDARTLAHHSITGLWKTSFMPAPEANAPVTGGGAHRAANSL